MGDLVKLCCSDCGWKISGSTGQGMFSLNPLENEINQLSPSIKKQIQKAVNEQNEVSGSVLYNRVIIQCESCNQIGFRTQTLISVFVGNEIKSIANNFRCNRCRKKVVCLDDNKFATLPCPNCNNDSVNVEPWGFWD